MYKSLKFKSNNEVVELLVDNEWENGYLIGVTGKWVINDGKNFIGYIYDEVIKNNYIIATSFNLDDIEILKSGLIYEIESRYDEGSDIYKREMKLIGDFIGELEAIWNS